MSNYRDNPRIENRWTWANVLQLAVMLVIAVAWYADTRATTTAVPALTIQVNANTNRVTALEAKDVDTHDRLNEILARINDLNSKVDALHR